MFINNKEQGETPLTANLAKGSYSIKLTHRNHYDLEKRINIADANTALDFRLQRTKESKQKIGQRIGQLTLGTIFMGAGIAAFPGEEEKGGPIALISIGLFFYTAAYYFW